MYSSITFKVRCSACTHTYVLIMQRQYNENVNTGLLIHGQIALK